LSKERAQSKIEEQTQPVTPVSSEPLTVTEVELRGEIKLNAEEIKNLIIDKMITIKLLSTGEEINGYYDGDGTRPLIEFDKGVTIRGEDTAGATRDPYRIDNDQLHTVLDGKQRSTTIYRLGECYLAAMSNDDGIVKYEVFRPGRNLAIAFLI
jgi:hypothetical protein